MHFQGKERQLHYRWFEGEAIIGGKGPRPPFTTMGRREPYRTGLIREREPWHYQLRRKQGITVERQRHYRGR